MKRMALGAVAGLAVWFGSALAAEAQQITPTGPMHIYSNDTSLVYSATITTNYSFTLYLTVTNNGTNVYGGQWFCQNSGPTYNFSSPSLSTSTWGLQIGSNINFHTIVQITPTYRFINDFTRTVEKPITMISPTKTEWMLAELPAAVKQEEQKLLATKEENIA